MKGGQASHHRDAKCSQRGPPLCLNHDAVERLRTVDAFTGTPVLQLPWSRVHTGKKQELISHVTGDVTTADLPPNRVRASSASLSRDYVSNTAIDQTVNLLVALALIGSQ